MNIERSYNLKHTILMGKIAFISFIIFEIQTKSNVCLRHRLTYYVYALRKL